MVDERSLNVTNNSIRSFTLPVCLRVVSCAEFELATQSRKYLLEKLSREARVSITDNRAR